MVQANWVSSELSARNIENEIQVITTKGDVVKDRFDKIEGKGFFTAEIEQALRDKQIDLAVHCLKDLPTAESEGLAVRAVTEREDPYDVIVTNRELDHTEKDFPDLGGLRIGTSSNRRVAGLAHFFPDAQFVPIRGNVPTRIAKMQKGEADVVILARAGLNRLNTDMSDLYLYPAPPPLLVPAPGQGALALQMRADDDRDISFFHHQETALCTGQERRILKALEGGCQLPLGVLVQRNEKGFCLKLFLGNLSSGFENKAQARMFIDLEGETAEELADEALTMLLHPVFKG